MTVGRSNFCKALSAHELDLKKGMFQRALEHSLKGSLR